MSNKQRREWLRHKCIMLVEQDRGEDYAEWMNEVRERPYWWGSNKEVKEILSRLNDKEDTISLEDAKKELGIEDES